MVTKKSPKRALITGATAGIGHAIALDLSRKGYELIVTGRRRDRLAKLKADCEKEGALSVWTSCFDVSSLKDCLREFEENKKEWSKVTVLVNCAGLAKGVDRLQEGQFEDWDTMIDTNVKGLLYMTRLILPGMIEEGVGHVVNLGSVAGRWTYPKGAVYAATKFAVRALSEGLRMDLQGLPIRVTNIEPGMVETEFSVVRFGDADRAKAVYAGMTPLTAQDISETVVWCIERPIHVNIQELVIFPVDQASIQNVHRRDSKENS